MFEKKKLEILRGIKSEAELRPILRDLFKKIGYSGVRITHGADELGKDIVYYEENRLHRREYTAVVVKVGQISGSAAGKGVNIPNIANQVVQCFTNPYDDTETKQKVNVGKVLVLTNYSISNSARQQIVTAYGAKAIGAQVNVEFFEDADLLPLFDEYWPDFFYEKDPFIFEYYATISKQFETLSDLKSFGYSKEGRKFGEIFIIPTVSEEIRTTSKRIDAQKPPIQFKHYSPDDLIGTKGHSFLVGAAGSGKSTLLRHISLKIIEKNQKQHKRGVIPIALRFKDLYAAPTLPEAIKVELEKYNIGGYQVDVGKMLKDDEVSLMLDGLDEIPNDEHRMIALEKVQQFSREFPRVRVIATSREIDFLKRKESIKGFRRLDVKPLDFPQVNKFLSQWFAHNLLLKERLLKALRETALINKLPRTPLALTLIAIIFEERTQELPANITELYDMFTDLYMGRWDMTRSVENLYDFTLKQRICMNLAEWMHERRVDEVSEDAIMSFVEEFLEERRLNFKAFELLNEIVERSNLLVKNDRGNWQFKHLSFQEYFTSKKYFQDHRDEGNLISLFLDMWWQEVTFFYCGTKKEAPEFLKRIQDEVADEDLSDKINKVLSLGSCLQAAFLTPHKPRKGLISYALQKFVECLVGMIEYAGASEKDYIRMMPRIIWLAMVREFFVRNYSSAYLVEATQEIFDELLAAVDKDKEGRIVKGDICLKLYFVASAMAFLEDYKGLVKLTEVAPDDDYSLALLLKYDLMRIGTAVDPGVRKQLEMAQSKIDKRVSKARAAIARELERPAYKLQRQG